MEEEIWKDIPGYEGLYQASTLGGIRSIRGGQARVMSQINHRYGKRVYKQIQLSFNGKDKTIGVHRLIALAFIPNPDNKPQIDHIDGNPSNNRVSNLRWVTAKENANNPISIERHRAYSGELASFYGKKHSEEARLKMSRWRTGRFIGPKNHFYGKTHSEETRKIISEKHIGVGCIPVVQLTKTGEFIKEWQGAIYAARELGISSPSSIAECCRGKRKTVGGYKWRYKDEQA